MNRIALLAGLLSAPAILLAMGHHLRRRPVRTRKVFWGGVIGHTLGMGITVVAMLLPPVAWSTADGMRTQFIHWSMLVGFCVGMLLAALLSRPPRSKRS
jgi:hypothetical protein